MSRNAPTKSDDEFKGVAEKPLSLRYAEIIELREAIQRAQAASKSCITERIALN